MLCIARSVAEHGEFRPEDVVDRFVEWYDSGPFDIGRMTVRALSRLTHGAAWDDAGHHV
ncbi:ADP-ribosyl-(dinitrogen reductase) hydrolase [Haloferax elongans ATCC BAA-1513]|uniref:ADP-ribosyl-(Dinitrogen reductase) hydrolase n=1 Tax=Haloferax elongans ATCC BAA-1513 TaxID=1230453 RepID=M0H8T9_HALEO|nr:ADP-ribosyl-(dinitrogen reductase) hydrolase [Haloferax elongans ATCC BAA-1513]